MSTVGQSLIFVGQSNNYNTGTPIQMPFNYNPFYLKFITGNIRICQGCRKSLRAADGTIPSPPYNIAIARAERRTYRDTGGNLVTPKKETVCHYHVRVDCIRSVHCYFVPGELRIPSDIHSQLLYIHREYLSGQFGLSV